MESLAECLFSSLSIALHVLFSSSLLSYSVSHMHIHPRFLPFSLTTLYTNFCMQKLICGDWTLFVRAESWEGTGNDAEGLSCDIIGGGDCDPKFLFCVRQHASSGSNTEICPFGRVETGEFDSGDSFSFGSSYIDQDNNVPNPIPFSNEGNYPVSLFTSFLHIMCRIFL